MATPNAQQIMDQRFATVQKRFSCQIKSGRVRVMRRDSATALASLPDHSLDLVYIDGNHLYDFVKSDLEYSYRKVKPGGYITGDDYGPGHWWNGGVKRAVDEFGWREGVSLVWIIGTQFVFQKTSHAT